MLANRVREFTNTEGSGDVTLGGALAGHVRFSDAFEVGDAVSYVIEDGDNFEIGTGTLRAGGLLERTSVSETLEDGVHARDGAVPLALSGNARVYCALTADYLERPELAADVIREVTGGAGVVVDGVHLKDGGAQFSAPVSFEGETVTVSGKLQAGVLEHAAMQMGAEAGRAWFAPLTDGAPDATREFGYEPSGEHWYMEPDFSLSGKISVAGGARISVQNKTDGGPGHGLFWWDDDNTDWGSYLATGSAGISLGGQAAALPLDGRAGLHLRNRAPNDPAAGFLWENAGEQCLMSLSAASGDLGVKGDAVFGGRITVHSGSAAAPSLSFTGDDDTGFYRLDTNCVGVAIAGQEKARIDGGGLQMSALANIRNSGGSAMTPSYTFLGDTNTGMYREGADQIGFTANGYKRVTLGNQTGVPNVSGMWINNGGAVSLAVGSDINATTLTDMQPKAGRIAVPHYLNAEEPVALLFASSDETSSQVRIGGGSTIMNAATHISFYTAPGNVGGTGSLRWQMSPSGNFAGGAGCNIVKQAGGDVLRLSGGAAGSTGANLALYGDTHSGRAHDIEFRADDIPVLSFNHSTGHWDFQDQAIVTGGIVRGLAAPTASRPSASAAGAGAQMFDTTLGQPIWSNGSAWVDAGGAAV